MIVWLIIPFLQCICKGHVNKFCWRSSIVFSLSVGTLVIFNWISTKFHIWIASTKLSFKFENGFCPIKDNQQKGGRLSVCSYGHSTLVIYYVSPLEGLGDIVFPLNSDVTKLCLLYNLKTVKDISMKLHTFVKHIQSTCHAQEL